MWGQLWVRLRKQSTPSPAPVGARIPPVPTLPRGNACSPPLSLHRRSLHPAGLFIISICSCLSLLRDTNSKHPSPARTCRSQPQPAGDSGSGGAAPCSGGSHTPPPVPGGPLGARARVTQGGDTQGVTGAQRVARPARGWAGETGGVCSPWQRGWGRCSWLDPKMVTGVTPAARQEAEHPLPSAPWQVLGVHPAPLLCRAPHRP